MWTILVLCVPRTPGRCGVARGAAPWWPRVAGSAGSSPPQLLLLLVLMLVTTAPRDVSDDGQRYACIEEPLGGLNPLSSDATDACVQASWTTIAFALLGSVALVTGEYVVLRGRGR
jgi:hypothetical protein